MPFSEPTYLSPGIRYTPNSGIYRDAALTAAQVGNVLPVAKTAGRPNRGPCPPGTEGLMNSGFRDFDADPRTTDGKPTEADITALAGHYKVGDRTVRRWFNMPSGLHGERDPANFVPVLAVGRSLDQWRERTQDDSLTDQQRVTAERVCRRLYLAAPLVVPGGWQRDPLYHKGDRSGNPYELRSHEVTLAGCARTIRQVFNGSIRLDRVSLENAWVQIEVYPAEQGWDVVVLIFFPLEGES